MCATAFPLQAATNATTNEAAIAYPAASLRLERAERSDVLIARFFEEVSDSDSIVFDRFTGPSSRLAWARRQNNLGYESLDRFNADGASMFASIGLDSLRTAAIAVLPVDWWEEYWERKLASFIMGSIGNPQEEHIEIRSLSYSAVRSSWERANENAGIQWGVRPWRTSPYLYFLAHAGRLDGRRLITFEGRAGYTMFGATRIEGRLTFQLPASFRLAGSGSFDPGRVGSGGPGATHFAVTLERVLGSRALNPEGVFYVGFRSGVNGNSTTPRQENLIVAGLSRRW